MKKLFIWAAVIAIAAFVLAVSRDQIIKSVITVVASEITGAPVHIDHFSLGIFNQTVKIAGFKIYNPKGFSRDILVDLTKVNVTYDLGNLLKNKLHFVNVEVELRELGLEKNKDGRLNVDSLKVSGQGDKPENKPPEQMPLRIDALKLGIGRIVSKDYNLGEKPVVNVYEINIHKSYKNITSVRELAALILAEPMKAAGIKGAKIYGAAMLAGTAVLPVAIAFTFTGKDSARQDFSEAFDNVYEAGLKVLKEKGRVRKEDKSAGVIFATVNSAQVALKVIKKSDNNTQVVVSARKYLFPKPEIAGGVLYGVSIKLRQGG